MLHYISMFVDLRRNCHQLRLVLHFHQNRRIRLVLDFHVLLDMLNFHKLLECLDYQLIHMFLMYIILSLIHI